jgi:hypothetical protein
MCQVKIVFTIGVGFSNAIKKKVQRMFIVTNDDV